MGMGAEGYACALLCAFSRLQEVKPIGKTRNPCQVTRRSREPAEPWLASNLLVTLPLAVEPEAEV